MRTIKKYVVIRMLQVFKEKGCDTIDEAINLLNKELKNDTDVVFSWRWKINEFHKNYNYKYCWCAW